MEGTLPNWISHISEKRRIAGSNVFIVHFEKIALNNGMYAQKSFSVCTCKKVDHMTELISFKKESICEFFQGYLNVLNVLNVTGFLQADCLRFSEDKEHCVNVLQGIPSSERGCL